LSIIARSALETAARRATAAHDVAHGVAEDADRRLAAVTFV
jgi:hypothetical protein